MDEINAYKQMMKEGNSLLLVPTMLLNLAIRISIDKKISMAIRTSINKKYLFHQDLMFKQVLEIFCIYLIQVLVNPESRQDADLART